MIDFSQFHFVRPWWLLAFLPLAWLVWSKWKRRVGSRNWEAICDPALLPHILIGNERGAKRWSTLATGLCGALAILALAGPVWQKLPQPVFSTQSALVIALDLSRSMDATDVNPSRLARARFKVADILARRGEGETALLVYAGDAFTVTPLTNDAATIESQLKALTTDIMPVQGNRTDTALSKAMELLRQAGASRGDILLITDEVICGFGRLGEWFGADHYQVRPDLMTFAKGVSSGYLPLGGQTQRSYQSLYGESKHPDLSASYFVRKEYEADHPDRIAGKSPRQQHPEPTRR